MSQTKHIDSFIHMINKFLPPKRLKVMFRLNEFKMIDTLEAIASE